MNKESRVFVILALLMSDKSRLLEALAELEEREKIIRQWIEEDKQPNDIEQRQP